MDFREMAQKYIENRNLKEFRMSEHYEDNKCYVFTVYHPTIEYVGDGPVVINKEDRRFFEYGSQYSVEKSMGDYRRKIMFEKIARQFLPEIDILKTYNMSVVKIIRKWPLIEKIAELGFQYVIPEIVGETIFRIPRAYNSELIRKRLKDLPCIFNNVSGIEICRILYLHSLTRTVELEIFEYAEVKRATNIKNSTEEDLQPVW